MSTKRTIKWRRQTKRTPGYHLYDDAMDAWINKGKEPPVYLSLEGVQVELTTSCGAGACVTVKIPRAIARELGLLVPNVPDSEKTDC